VQHVLLGAILTGEPVGRAIERAALLSALDPELLAGRLREWFRFGTAEFFSWRSSEARASAGPLSDAGPSIQTAIPARLGPRLADCLAGTRGWKPRSRQARLEELQPKIA
jgi:hypothetical protein